MPPTSGIRLTMPAMGVCGMMRGAMIPAAVPTSVPMPGTIDPADAPAAADEAMEAPATPALMPRPTAARPTAALPTVAAAARTVGPVVPVIA